MLKVNMSDGLLKRPLNQEFGLNLKSELYVENLYKISIINLIGGDLIQKYTWTCLTEDFDKFTVQGDMGLLVDVSDTNLTILNFKFTVYLLTGVVHSYLVNITLTNNNSDCNPTVQFLIPSVGVDAATLENVSIRFRLESTELAIDDLWVFTPLGPTNLRDLFREFVSHLMSISYIIFIDGSGGIGNYRYVSSVTGADGSIHQYPITLTLIAEEQTNSLDLVPFITNQSQITLHSCGESEFPGE